MLGYGYLTAFFTIYAIADVTNNKTIIDMHSTRKVDEFIKGELLPDVKENQGDLAGFVSLKFLQAALPGRNIIQ